MDNNLMYDEFAKQRFLDNQGQINSKYYNYVIHSINAIEGLDKIATNRDTQRLIRKSRNFTHYQDNLTIINKYVDYISEYNSSRTISEKKLIINEIVSYLEINAFADFSKITNKDVINVKEWYMKKNLYSNRKKYQWVLKDFLKFLYSNKYVETDFSILFDKFS